MKINPGDSAEFSKLVSDAEVDEGPLWRDRNLFVVSRNGDLRATRTLVNATTGWLVERMGWFDFYMLCALLAVPGMVLLLRVAPWSERE